MTFKTITEAKRANKAAGHYWFSPNTVRLFKSRVETPIIAGRYWVESTTTYNDVGREYKLVRADDDGDISYVHGPNYECLVYGTLQAAKAALLDHVAKETP